MSLTFALRKAHYQYRPLRERHTGWDVFALQSALFACGFPIVVDGLFGPATTNAVKHYQAGEGLVSDGIAGILTQRALCLELGTAAELEAGLVPGHMKGHLESECGFQVGNYTEPYKNLTRDMGVVQDNLPKSPRTGPPTEEDCRGAFDTPAAIKRLATFVRTRYGIYWQGGHNTKGGVGGQPMTKRRAMELAAGAWNRPAWTDKLARGERLTPEQSDWIEGYIDRVLTYAEWS